MGVVCTCGRFSDTRIKYNAGMVVPNRNNMWCDCGFFPLPPSLLRGAPALSFPSASDVAVRLHVADVHVFSPTPVVDVWIRERRGGAISRNNRIKYKNSIKHAFASRGTEKKKKDVSWLMMTESLSTPVDVTACDNKQLSRAFFSRFASSKPRTRLSTTNTCEPSTTFPSLIPLFSVSPAPPPHTQKHAHTHTTKT